MESPEPDIHVLEPYGDENDEALSDMEDFPADFLKAQTKSFPRYAFGFQDQPTDWDSYVVESAAGCSTPVERVDTTNVETGNHVSDICEYLIDVFSDFSKYTKFLSYRGEVAQDLLDLLQKLLDHVQLQPRFRAILYVALVRLCRKSELYPQCFSLDDVHVHLHDYPLSNGSFGEVYRANFNGRVVCAKVARMFLCSNQALLHKSFFREAVVWGQLSHPNILPFYGIHRLNDPRKRLCLISPWMTNGNVNEYLKTRPQLNRTPLVIHDIASGIEYLHENGVVHGDLKSLNILVTDSERACLADFGLSYVTDASGLRGHALSSNHAEGGTAGFEAPELVDPDIEFSRRTEASDVYAFGMVCYEMFTGERPFSKVKPVALITKIMKGQHPTQPTGQVYQERGMTDNVWSLMTSCWTRIPQQRPSAAQIKQLLPRLELERTTEEWTRIRRPVFDSFNGQDDATLTRALPHLRSLAI